MKDSFENQQKRKILKKIFSDEKRCELQELSILKDCTDRILNDLKNGSLGFETIQTVMALLGKSSNHSLVAELISAILIFDIDRIAENTRFINKFFTGDAKLSKYEKDKWLSPEFSFGVFEGVVIAGEEVSKKYNNHVDFVMAMYDMIFTLHNDSPGKSMVIQAGKHIFSAEEQKKFFGTNSPVFKKIFISLAGDDYLQLFGNFCNQVSKCRTEFPSFFKLLLQEVGDKIYYSLPLEKKYQLFHQLQFLNK